MASSTSFANGQTLISSAIVDAQTMCSAIIAPLLNNLLGLTVQNYVVNAFYDSFLVPLYTTISGPVTPAQTRLIGQGITGNNIPANTTVVDVLLVSGKVTFIISNPITASISNGTVTIQDANNPLLGPNDPTVRFANQVSGAPAFAKTDQVCFVLPSIVDNWYDKVPDNAWTANEDSSNTLQIEYTRVWRIALSFYGAATLDSARLIKSALQLDFVSDTLAASNLYLVSEISAPIRVPELFEGTWWERVDLAFELYEQVNETIIVQTITSVEVIIENANGIVEDFEIAS